MIRKLSNRTRGFYALLGPFLSRRQVVAELGAPVWDDDGAVWYADVLDGVVRGFCVSVAQSTHVVHRSAYVVPQYRGSGVYRDLFLARLADAGEREIRAVVRPNVLGLFLEHGFEEVGRRGQFNRLRRRGQFNRLRRPAS